MLNCAYEGTSAFAISINSLYSTSETVFSPVTSSSLALLAKAAHVQPVQNQRLPLCCKSNHNVTEKGNNPTSFSVRCYVSSFHQVTSRQGHKGVQCRCIPTNTSTTK